MRYLYFSLQCVLLTFVAMLFFLVFSRYRYDSVFEKRVEKKIKTPRCARRRFSGNNRRVGAIGVLYLA
jgi:hypothetical protein